MINDYRQTFVKFADEIKWRNDGNNGYSWAIFTTPRNTRLIAHNGGNGIFAADFLRYVDEDVVIIGLSNTAGKPAWKVTSQLARIAFGYNYIDPFEELEMADETVASFPSDDEFAKLAKKWEFHNSSTGRRSAALLETISRKDENYIRNFIQSNFAPDFLNAFPIEVHLTQFKKMQEDFSEFEVLSAMKMSINSAMLNVRSLKTGIKAFIELVLEPQAPYRILGLQVQSEE